MKTLTATFNYFLNTVLPQHWQIFLIYEKTSSEKHTHKIKKKTICMGPNYIFDHTAWKNCGYESYKN